MSDATLMLAEALSLGVRFEVRGDRITYECLPNTVPKALMARLREHKAEVLRLLRERQEAAEKPATLTNYVHPDGRIETGQPDPMPRPAEPWPADLNDMLRRVSVAFEWTNADRHDFVAWARRSPDGLADTRVFLEAEAARLPVPGLSDRRRVVLERLAADPALRVAWLCEDDGADPLCLVVAIRGKGACELAVPCEKFDALALPSLIARLAQKQGDAA